MDVRFFMEKFLKQVQEILDTETEIQPEMTLAELDWDSLATVSFLAMVSVEYEKNLRRADFRNAVTVQDLFDIVTAD